jgi:thiol-disulfide isomerase/thioredoxin
MYFRRIGLVSLGMVLLIPGCSDTATTTDTSTTDQSSDAAPPPLTRETLSPDSDATSETTSVAQGDNLPNPVTNEANAELRKTLLAGLDGYRGFPDAFGAAMEAYEGDKKDPKLVEQYIGMVEQAGMFHAQGENMAAAHTAFRTAAEVLSQAEKEGIEIEPSPLIGYVHYNYACVLSSTGETQEALSRLQLAFTSGFNDFDQLESDSDLSAVRELPDFAEHVTNWQAEILAHLKAHAAEELAKGETFAFDFELTNVVDGEALTLGDHAGKVCIVDIWGTWCPPCRAEIPSFVKLQEKFGADGFQMLGLNQESGPDEESKTKTVTDYIEGNGINYPCALISDDVLASVPEFEGFPTTLFIDKTGKVRMKAVGLHEYEFLEAVVEVLLAEEAASESTGD